MKNKGVKSVFRRGSAGTVLGSFPTWSILVRKVHRTFSYLSDWLVFYDIEKYRKLLLESYRKGTVSSFRMVVGDFVIEAHVDKHNNLIYREYEKKK